MKSLLTICTVAGLIFAAITPSTSPAGIVGIDSRHGFDASAKLATGENFDAFRATITALGHTIVPKSSFNTADLAGLDMLILNQPYSQNSPAAYSSSEIAAIHDFVNSGGGLMVHGEGGTGSDAYVGNLNMLVSPYGVVYAGSATEGSGHTISGFVSHPVTEGVSMIGIDYQRREITITSPAIDLTIGSGADNALAVVNGFAGAGNVVLLSDTNIWDDGETGSDRPITFGDNQLLLENIVQFTIPEPATALLLGLGGVALLRKRRTVAREMN